MKISLFAKMLQDLGFGREHRVVQQQIHTATSLETSREGSCNVDPRVECNNFGGTSKKNNWIKQEAREVCYMWEERI